MYEQSDTSLNCGAKTVKRLMIQVTEEIIGYWMYD